MLKESAALAGGVAEFLGIQMNVKAMSEVPQEQYYRQRK